MKKIIMLIAAITLMMFVLTACDEVTPTEPDSSFQQGQDSAEQSTQNVINNDTLPKLSMSLDRENLKNRLEFLNQPDRIGYLYLMSNNGQLVREVQVHGKVTNLNSFLTPMEQVEIYDNVDLGEYSGSVLMTVQSPDLDGTYGENAEGVFWFDANGVYQEWNGLYFYSSERQTMTTQPLLIEMTTSE